MVDCWRFWC